MRLRLAVAATALFALAACGSNGGSGDNGVASLNGDKKDGQAQASDNKSDEDKMREFTKCMREHGVDMPDPDESGRVQGRATSADGADGDKMKKANDACMSLLPNGGKPKPLSPEDLDKQRKTAKCMREHGIDMPDPDPNNPGMVTLGGDGDKDKMDKAMKECGMGAMLDAAPADGGSTGGGK
jgi:hypothetical protein